MGWFVTKIPTQAAKSGPLEWGTLKIILLQETDYLGHPPPAIRDFGTWATNQTASDSYDQDTDHGRNQGTIIDLSTNAADGS